jgi:phosphoserine phosphatase
VSCWRSFTDESWDRARPPRDVEERQVSSDRRYRLIAFDVDGTLVGNPQRKVVWELLNNRFPHQTRVDRLWYDAFMERHITYTEWVELDVLSWIMAGATRAEMARVVAEELQLTPGAEQTVRALHQAGYQLAIISGTIDLTLDVLFPNHPFHEVYTNRIEFDESGLIVDWWATPFDMEGKAHALEQIAARMGIPLHQTVFVGDNINDVFAMQKAGLAVAYEPKAEPVRQAADCEIGGCMTALLGLLEQ